MPRLGLHGFYVLILPSGICRAGETLEKMPQSDVHKDTVIHRDMRQIREGGPSAGMDWTCLLHASACAAVPTH